MRVSCSEYAGMRGMALRTLARISGPAPNVFCSSGLLARASGAMTSSNASPPITSAIKAATVRIARPLERVSRRLSGTAAPSTRNGVKVTAVLSLVTTRPARLAMAIAALNQPGRRMNDTSADRYTRHSKVA